MKGVIALLLVFGFAFATPTADWISPTPAQGSDYLIYPTILNVTSNETLSDCSFNWDGIPHTGNINNNTCDYTLAYTEMFVGHTYNITVNVTSSDTNLSATNTTNFNYFGCGYVNESVTLVGNITIDESACLSVYTDAVSIDCAGYTVSGTGTNGSYTRFGIYDEYMGYSANVSNCEIVGFETAIYFSGGYHNFFNISLHDNWDTNLWIDAEYGGIYDNITSIGSMYGAYFDTISDTNFSNSVFANSTASSEFYVVASTNSKFENLTFNHNESIGYDVVYFSDLMDSRFENIKIHTDDSFGNYGFYAFSLSNTTFKDMNITSSKGLFNGFYGGSANTNNFTNITISNFSVCFILTGKKKSGHDNIVTNSVFECVDSGVYLLGASNNIIYNNIMNATTPAEMTDNVYCFPCFPRPKWRYIYPTGNQFNINKTNLFFMNQTNIIGGLWMGGNFYAQPDGLGYSEICNDILKDGICDEGYEIPYLGSGLSVSAYDFFPLTLFNQTQNDIARAMGWASSCTTEQDLILPFIVGVVVTLLGSWALKGSLSS